MNLVYFKIVYFLNFIVIIFGIFRIQFFLCLIFHSLLYYEEHYYINVELFFFINCITLVNDPCFDTTDVVVLVVVVVVVAVVTDDS